LILTHILSPFTWGRNIGNDEVGYDHKQGCASPIYESEDDELIDALGESTKESGEREVAMPIERGLRRPIRSAKIPAGKLKHIRAKGNAEITRPATMYVASNVKMYWGRIGPTIPKPSITAIDDAQRNTISILTISLPPSGLSS